MQSVFSDLMNGVNNMKEMNIEEILDKNPHIGKEEFMKFLELFQKMQSISTKRSYGIFSPYIRNVPKRQIKDPRTVYVGNSPR